MENIDNVYGRQKVNNIVIKKVPEILAHTQRNTQSCFLYSFPFCL